MRRFELYLSYFGIILRWLYVAKLELFLPSKPPLLLGILMQPAHSLLSFPSINGASRDRVEFWKKRIKVALDKKIHNTPNVP
jgi:hypothetical protein